MFGTSHPKTFPIGIDFGFDAVRLVQLCRTPAGGLAVRAAARRSFTATGDAASAVAAVEAVVSVLAMKEFIGRGVVLSLPGEMVRTRTVRLTSPAAPASGDELPPELREAFDFDLSDATLRLVDAGFVRRSLPEGREVIALAVRNADVDSLVEQLHRHGLRAVSMEARMLALHRLALHQREAGAPLALLDMGGDAARMLIASGGSIAFLRDIAASTGELCKSLARTLGISVEEARELRRRVAASAAESAPEADDPVRRAVIDAARGQMEALAAEVARYLRYHAVTFRGAQPGTLIISGCEANDSQLHACLVTQTGMNIEVIDPLVGIDPGGMRVVDRGPTVCEWAVAMGLALKQADRGGSWARPLSSAEAPHA